MESCLKRAQALHRRLPIFVGYFNFDSETFRENGGSQSDFGKLDEAGVRTLVVSIGYGCYFQTGRGQYELAGPDDWLLGKQLERVDAVVKTVRRCNRARLITRAADLDAAPDDGRVGVILHLTGNNHMVDLASVDTFFEHGVRASHPAMQYHDRWCRSLGGRPAPVLSDFGHEVIARMNELGILLDTAHASDESALAFVEASRKPVIDSHTTSRDLVPPSRGLRDATLRRIADSGGVIGVHFADHLLSAAVWQTKYSPYERDGWPKPGFEPRLWRYHAWVLEHTKDPEQRMRMRKDSAVQERFYRENALPPDEPVPPVRLARLSHLADLVDYLVNLVGDEHVGLGGDVNGIGADQWPEGMDHVGQLPHLTAELLRRGYREEILTKLLSSNWLRVYRATLPA